MLPVWSIFICLSLAASKQLTILSHWLVESFVDLESLDNNEALILKSPHKPALFSVTGETKQPH